MTTKLKIDLMQGVLEVEGSETFVKAIYSDFKVHFIGDDAGEALATSIQRRRRSTRGKPELAAPAEATPPPEPEPEPPAPVVKPDYKLVPNLALTAAGDRPALVEFMDAKLPITNEERNLVFLYYLQYMAKTRAITVDHIFTCYKEANIRMPLNLVSSLQATADQRRWIKVTNTGRLNVTPSGKLYVEKQLPKKLKG